MGVFDQNKLKVKRLILSSKSSECVKMKHDSLRGDVPVSAGVSDRKFNACTLSKEVNVEFMFHFVFFLEVNL